MTLKQANQLFNDGTFAELFKAGFLTDKVFLYRDIYLWVNAQMTARNIKKEQAVIAAEVQFGVCRATVFNAMKKFGALVELPRVAES